MDRKGFSKHPFVFELPDGFDRKCERHAKCFEPFANLAMDLGFKLYFIETTGEPFKTCFKVDCDYGDHLATRDNFRRLHGEFGVCVMDFNCT